MCFCLLVLCLLRLSSAQLSIQRVGCGAVLSYQNCVGTRVVAHMLCLLSYQKFVGARGVAHMFCMLSYQKCVGTGPHALSSQLPKVCWDKRRNPHALLSYQKCVGTMCGAHMHNTFVAHVDAYKIRFY